MMFMARNCRAAGFSVVEVGRIDEFLGDLGFGRPEDDAGLLLAFGLGLP